MIKMVIELDEEKIAREDQYDVAEMWKHIDAYFQEKRIPKISTGVYAGRGLPSDFGNIGGFYIRFHRCDWFVDNVLVWDWYNSDGEDDPEDFRVESFLPLLAKDRLGVG